MMESVFIRQSVLLLGIACSSISNVFAESLLDIYTLSLISDPQLKQSQYSRQIANAEKRQEIARFLPNINISANTTDNSEKRSYGVSLFNGKEDYNSHGYSVTLKQAIFNFESHLQLKQTKQRINQLDIELLSAEQALILRVAERYFDVLAAQDGLRFSAAEKKAVERQLAQAERQLKVGLVAITDVYEAKARLDTTVANEIDAQNKLANSLESLREVTNRYHGMLQTLSEELILREPQLSGTEAWETLAVNNNLQLISLRYKQKILRSEINKQRASHLPTLDLVVSYSDSTSGGGDFGRSDTKASAIGLQFNMPIYQGGITSARVQKAQHQYERNSEELEANLRRTRSQAKKSYLGILASIARVNSLKQSVISYQQALKAIEVGFEAGMRTTSDVLQANSELYQAQRNYKRAQYDYILNGLRLKQAVGDLSIADLEKVDTWLK